MAALATPAELATYLQTATAAEAALGNPDLLDTARATQLLDNASAAIRDACGWSITQETVTGQRVYPDPWSGYFLLSTGLLTALAVTVSGVAGVDGTTYTWTPGGVVRLLSWIPRFPAAIVLATYTHGYPTVPAGVRDVCLERAALAYTNPSRYRSEHIEGIVTVFDNPDLDRDSRLGPYRLPGIA